MGPPASFLRGTDFPVAPQVELESYRQESGKWRRVLHGMLQRDPQRRTRLPQLRRQLVQLEQRMEEAERLRSNSATFAVTLPPEPL